MMLSTVEDVGVPKTPIVEFALEKKKLKKVICLTMFYETVWREIAVARGTRKGWKVGNKITLLGSFTLHIINLYFGCVREEPL